MNQQTTDGEAIDEKSNGDVAARCEPAANHNLNANTNTNIIIRPYAEYFVRKEGKTGFFRMIRKNWHQMSILWPGILLLCGSTQMHIFWTIWELIRHQYEHHEIRNGVLFAWYFGAIIGFMGGAGLNNIWTKKWIYYFSGIVLLASSLFHIFHMCCEFYLHFGRILAGFVHGIVYTTIIQHASDNSSPPFRRCVILFLSALLAFPLIIAAFAIRPLIYVVEEPASRTHIAIGAITLVLSVLALILMPCTKDSIVFQISSSKDLEALQCMYEIRNEPRQSIRSDFNEFKLMVAQDCYDGGHLLRDGNIRPLCWILAARILCALLANNVVITISTMDVWKSANNRHGNYTFEDASENSAIFGTPLVIVQAAKLLIGLVVLLTVDRFPCKTNPPFCFYVSAFLLSTLNLMVSIVMAIDFTSENSNSIISTYVLMWTLNVINVLFVCISFGIDTFGYIQLSEGFSVAKRSWSIAIISVIETMIHVIFVLCLLIPYRLYYVYIHSIWIMLCSYCLICFMPNYHLFEVISLKRARQKFKN